MNNKVIIEENLEPRTKKNITKKSQHAAHTQEYTYFQKPHSLKFVT